MKFITDSFMIHNQSGRKLYNQWAKDLPVIDYHCHLDAKDIYLNKPFEDITQLWLGGDHYKWRAMRANGVSEDKITGAAAPEEKFQAWAETVEACFGNPLYHWTHLELHYYFNIEATLDSSNWREIMDACNQRLLQDDCKPRALISRSNVDVICTTDSPLDPLEYHRLLRDENEFTTRVLPTFRPDEIFEENPQQFRAFIDKLSALTGITLACFADLSKAMAMRIDYFHESGCRISDHGPVEIHYQSATPSEIERFYAKKCRGEALSQHEHVALTSAIFVMLAGHYKQRQWAMQLHFGALRSNNSQMKEKIGINTGFDSITDQCQLAKGLNGLLDNMARNNALPKTIIYNLNPAYNDIIATTIANFQSAEHGVKSPMQFGSGWWFNDTRRGMENQLNALADQGLLMNFVGMLTDSRSFISYTRHDYFRRILCNLIGGWVERGEVPDDPTLLSKLITNICHDNAKHYFQF